MLKIRLCFYWLLAWPALLSYFLVNSDNKSKIKKDLDRFESILATGKNYGFFWRLYRMLVKDKAFRSLYYMRLGHISILISFLLPGEATCHIGATRTANVGGGVFIQHGWSMVVNAKSVGENLWINQNVTIGYRGQGNPSIGNNVRIGTGAVVLGGITIGDNVNIGANAIVVEDVPSNVTVCSPKAVIVKRQNA